MTSTPPHAPQAAYPGPPVGPPTPAPLTRRAKVLVGVGAATFVLLWAAVLVAVVQVVGGLSLGRDFADLEPRAACATAVQEAVRISAEKRPPVLLEGVERLEVVEDARATYELPEGDGEATVLTCRGVGRWSDGDTTTPVVVGVTVEGDGDFFVYYEVPGPTVAG